MVNTVAPSGTTVSNIFSLMQPFDYVMGAPTLGLFYFDTQASQNSVLAFVPVPMNTVVVNGPGTFNGFIDLAASARSVFANGIVVSGQSSYTSAALGVGTNAPPTKTLDVGDGTGIKTIYVNGASSGNGNGSGINFANGGSIRSYVGGYSAFFGGTYNSALAVNGFDGLGLYTANLQALLIDTHQHVAIGGTTIPTIASGACGATTNGAPAAGSTDQSGEIVIGASATASCAVTFALTFTTAPKAVVLTPANAAAAALAAASPYVSALSASGFTFSAAVLANTSWYYHVY